MGVARIPVDLFNPGQVFACLGFLEATQVLLGDAEGCFDWRDESDVRFEVHAAGGSNPVETVLRFLVEAHVVALSPKGSGLVDRGDAVTVVDEEGVFPVSPTASENGKRSWLKESVLPIKIEDDSGQALSVAHWADVDNGRERLKTWGGAGGKSGASRMRDLLEATKTLIDSTHASVVADPFGSKSPVGGFRMDLHRDYIPIDIGFSLNFHDKMSAIGHPLVEIMAVIGLENARPLVIDRLIYRYGTWGSKLSLPLARPALGCANVATLRVFVAELGEPNEYDRSIRNVKEEPTK